MVGRGDSPKITAPLMRCETLGAIAAQNRIVADRLPAEESTLMADQVALRMGQSPEQIAYTLLRHVASAEQQSLDEGASGGREWILDTYAECLRTVRVPSGRLKQNSDQPQNTIGDILSR